MLKTTFSAAAAAILALTAFGAADRAEAQVNKTDPIKVISSQAAGGGIDALLRFVALKFQERNGQAMVVEPRAGASGVLAGAGCAKSTPDGTTICLLMTQQLILASVLHNKPQFDAEKDLIPITMLVHAPSAFAVHQSIPVKTLPELFAYTKANRGKLNYVGLGTANPTSVSVEWMKKRYDLDWTYIAYRGAGDGLQGFASGESHILFVGALNVLPFTQDGRGRGLFVPGDARLAQMPDVPTMRELGLDDSGIIGTSYGIFAPAGTSPEAIARLRGEFSAIIRAPEMKGRLDAAALIAVGDTSEEFTQFLANDRKRIFDLAKSLALPKID